MKILGLDLSTNASGWCVFDNKTKTIIEYGAIYAAGKDVDVRTKDMVRQLISQVISKKTFQLVVICSAPFMRNQRTYNKLKRIEYIIEGYLFMSNTPIKELADNQWVYNLGAKYNLDRRAKKEKSVRLMGEYLGYKNVKTFWSSDKCLARLDDKNTISDDMADAFCVACFYENTVKLQVEKDQEQLAKEQRAVQREVDRKQRAKERLRLIKRKEYLLEAKEFKKLYDKTGNKTALNSYHLRLKKADELL